MSLRRCKYQPNNNKRWKNTSPADLRRHDVIDDSTRKDFLRICSQDVRKSDVATLLLTVQEGRMCCSAEPT